MKVTEKLQKPHLVIDLEGHGDLDVVRAWVVTAGISILNIAGTRESKCRKCPGVCEEVGAFLGKVLVTI